MPRKLTRSFGRVKDHAAPRGRGRSKGGREGQCPGGREEGCGLRLLYAWSDEVNDMSIGRDSDTGKIILEQAETVVCVTFWASRSRPTRNGIVFTSFDHAIQRPWAAALFAAAPTLSSAAALAAVSSWPAGWAFSCRTSSSSARYAVASLR